MQGCSIFGHMLGEKVISNPELFWDNIATKRDFPSGSDGKATKNE